MDQLSDAQRILDIYRGGSYLDSQGKPCSLLDIVKMSNDELDRTHDWIQRAFPLLVPSAYNLDAPVLSLEVLAEMRGDQHIRDRAAMMAGRLYSFLVMWDGWLSPHNHNFKRITRALTFLRLMDMPEQVRAIHRTAIARVTSTDLHRDPAVKYWNAAFESSRQDLETQALDLLEAQRRHAPPFKANALQAYLAKMLATLKEAETSYKDFVASLTEDATADLNAAATLLQDKLNTAEGSEESQDFPFTISFTVKIPDSPEE